MKRYKMGFEIPEHSIWPLSQDVPYPSKIDAVEHPEGEWVRYEDVLLLIETNEAMYNLIMSERLIKE